MKTNSVPKIRFKGFTDDWEQRKAGEIFKSVSDKGYTDLPVLSASQELGMILRDEIGIDIKYDESSIKNYKRVKPGQFVIHLRSFQGGFAWSDIEGITSPAYTILDYQEPEEHCSKFWKIVLTSPMFITRLETVTYGIRDGRSISFTDFSTLNLNVPSIAEQQKIGEYFSKLDNLITLHQRKCEQTKELKKFMLQKMFPKKGEKNPEIRFQGFTDDWEQRKVSDLLEERNEQAPETEDYPLMAFIANEGVAPKGERYDRGALVKDAKNKNYKKTELGDFIYSSNNLETGSIGLNNYGNASISPVYSIFKPTGIADSDFIGRRFVRKDFINAMVKWRQGVVYGQWKIHESDFLKIEVAVPSLGEQQKIGEYFFNLDRLITLHQRKCEQLKELKKFMLQNMFPKKG
ncbi:restriction endonuclease subunit S [Streptococcus hyointestinalis]|nr:restriction endonuclease subunit S [Streptococcus hyointestinalis]